MGANEIAANDILQCGGKQSSGIWCPIRRDQNAQGFHLVPRVTKYRHLGVDVNDPPDRLNRRMQTLGSF
ncbi:hypothetical protein ACLOJK_010300 [Asimina triloba]